MDLLYYGFVLFFAIRVFRIIYRKLTESDDDLSSLGKWAVITGATDGIGKAFAEYFAAKGFDIVLVSRSRDKLEQVAQNLESKFHVSTRIIQADFTSLEENMYTNIENELRDLEIGVLINNVGVSYAHPEYFLDLKMNHNNLYADIINCNISSTVNLCRYVLPGMVSRGKGWIVNMSSGLADVPAPLLALYAASKSFISKFSEDLGIEYKSKGIRVQWLKPGLVATNMSAIKKTSWMVPSPAKYVESALADLQWKKCSEGFYSHVALVNIGKFLCVICPDLVASRLLSLNLGTRAKALRKCKNCNIANEKVE